MTDDYVTTTVKWSIENEPVNFASDDFNFTSCQGCSMYCDSLSLLHSLSSSTSSNPEALDGWCVHIISLASVMPGLFQEEVCQNLSAFAKFVKIQIQSTESCSMIKKTSTCLSFLTMVSVEKGFSEQVSRCSTCTFRLIGSQWLASCSNIRCKRGKNKKVSGNKMTQEVCCHLEEALPHWRAETDSSHAEECDSVLMFDDMEDNTSHDSAPEGTTTF